LLVCAAATVSGAKSIDELAEWGQRARIELLEAIGIRRHLLSAVTQGTVVTLAQAEVGAKTNETKHFQPLLALLDLAGTVVTFDTLHSVKANIIWLVETKQAHYIAVIKANQRNAHRQISGLPWQTIDIQDTTSETGHGRIESRSIKTMAIAENLGPIAFPTRCSQSGSTAAARKPGRRRLAGPTTRQPNPSGS
jgi:predicted transposase YbfD/YdcC